MDKIKVFNYNGSNITFSSENGVMVNATEMAKAFGKTTKDWLRTNASSEFISSLSSVRQICLSQLVVVKKGNSSDFEQGTWMHEDVALEFARWLSPTFAIWCNDRIKELLRYGMTATQPTLEQIVDNPDLVIELAVKLKTERAENAKLEQEREMLNNKLEQQAPKVAFANAIEASKSSCLIGELAKILTQNGYTIGQNRLFEWLRNNGYLGKKGEYYNIPNQLYIEQGLFEIKKGVRSGNEGVMHTTITTKVTGKGCGYFINKFLGGR
ncbi:phage antirepressor KilAC domain-containing protein [Prevotella corporis]|uniref:phage antirepressor KilAC domain-containing protein n=1 Tax=Prevotella corporis TaxID=28128 RepID=UPI0023F177A4|nr:phage antirepressor KilAC domain-containing protein [Prevotella corporis]